ncbi:hypothetical protein BESB_040600 [Besnoitia besnoiti]|uniref:Transmembrane protein n=1 Tax=Besnoitia besnoiti TaxID=94643 RepID=A0A2A9MP99_BESBE|nr:hypothetical protein BESB_040600 [Besnoitia besnoiti]PFH37602.1 hypothetical protein BESB_040600 [Besnoitia besnoiti]
MAGRLLVLPVVLLASSLATALAFNGASNGDTAGPQEPRGDSGLAPGARPLPVPGPRPLRPDTSSAWIPGIEGHRGIVSESQQLAAKLAATPERTAVAEVLRHTAGSLKVTLDRLAASREAYLADHSKVMNVLQKYASARELLDAGLAYDKSSEKEIADRLRAARDAFNTLFVLLSTTTKRAESVEALADALAANQATAFAGLLKLAKANMTHRDASGRARTDQATPDDFAAVRAAVYNMQDLAAAAEHATRATVETKTKQTQELAFDLIRRYELLASNRQQPEEMHASSGRTRGISTTDDARDSEQILSQRAQAVEEVQAYIKEARAAEDALFKELTRDAFKTVQAVAEETANTNEAALKAMDTTPNPDTGSNTAVIFLGVLLCLAVAALLALTVYAVSVVMSFQSKINAARMGEQTGQAHIED